MTDSGRLEQPVKEPGSVAVVRVTNCGRICLEKRKISLSRAMANQIVGIREVSEKIWLVSFMEYDLGFFDQDENRVEPAESVHTEGVTQMSSV